MQCCKFYVFKRVLRVLAYGGSPGDPNRRSPIYRYDPRALYTNIADCSPREEPRGAAAPKPPDEIAGRRVGKAKYDHRHTAPVGAARERVAGEPCQTPSHPINRLIVALRAYGPSV